MFIPGEHGMVYMREAAGRLTRGEPPLLLKKGLARTGRASLYSHGRCLLIAAGGWFTQQEGDSSNPVPPKQQQKEQQQQPRKAEGKPDGQALGVVAAARERRKAAAAAAGGAGPGPSYTDDDVQPQQPAVREAAKHLERVLGDLVQVLRRDSNAVQVCTLLDVRAPGSSISSSSSSSSSPPPSKGVHVVRVEDRGPYCYVVHFAFR
jgi:hypothetical protein